MEFKYPLSTLAHLREKQHKFGKRALAGLAEGAVATPMLAHVHPILAVVGIGYALQRSVGNAIAWDGTTSLADHFQTDLEEKHIFPPEKG